jgi:hypothetical protein
VRTGCTLQSERAWTGDDPMRRMVEHGTRVRAAPFRLPRQRALLPGARMNARATPQPGVEKHLIIEVGGAAIAISTAFSVRPWAAHRGAFAIVVLCRAPGGRPAGLPEALFLKICLVLAFVSIVSPLRSAPSLELSSPDRQTNRKLRDCFSVGDSLGTPACWHHARPRAQRAVFGITMSTASAET